jgi:hypothetical protein
MNRGSDRLNPNQSELAYVRVRIGVQDTARADPLIYSQLLSEIVVPRCRKSLSTRPISQTKVTGMWQRSPRTEKGSAYAGHNVHVHPALLGRFTRKLRKLQILRRDGSHLSELKRHIRCSP